MNILQTVASNGSLCVVGVGAATSPPPFESPGHTVKRVAWISCALAAVALFSTAACGGGGAHVVGVETRCQVFVGMSESLQRQFTDQSGAACAKGGYDVRQQITVKPANQPPYTVDVPITEKVTLGESWPP